MSEPIDLNHAFPNHIEAMREMRTGNGHFAKLYDTYLSVEKELHKIANEAETPEDAFVEQLKKKRLALKDEMLAMLNANAA